MIHLIKLSVGVSSYEELESYRDERAHWWGADYGEEVHVHRTRTMPKRADELIAAGGSIYWVIAGIIRCRQPILRFQPATDREGKECCDIIMSRDMVRTMPYPKRPFQGWRYLEPKDAPPDMEGGMQEEGAEFIAEELAKLGLL